MFSHPGNAPAIFQAKHNLLDSGNRKSSPSEWENGISFIPDGCFPASVQEVGCPPNLKDGFHECPDAATFFPFVVQIGGSFIAHEDDGVLERQLEIKTSAAAERALAEGATQVEATANSNFSGFTPVTATGLDAVQAVGLLEARLLEKGQQGGTIHMSPFDAAQCKNLLFEDGGDLYTKTLKSLVIVGNYPAGNIFIHGGEVDVYLSEKFTNVSYQELSTNRFVYMAERLVLVTWNPCYEFKAVLDEAPGYEDPLTDPVLDA